MYIDFIIERFKESLDKEAVIWNNSVYDYRYLLDKYEFWLDFLKENTQPGSVVAVRADYNPDSISLMLALIENGNIFVPFSFANKDIEEKIQSAEVEHYIKFDKEGNFQFIDTEIKANHQLIEELRQRKHPGVIVFSSGSTGKPKAALHDYTHLLNKFKVQRATLRTVTFLLFDHWGGINTLLYILSNTGVIGVPDVRSPEEVCEFIERYKIELLPTTPTFINLILISKAYLKHDISSLKVVSYGTEMMPESTLKAFNKLFPKITLKQTYGLTELGVMRTKSESNDSLWVKVGGEDYETKVVDNVLFIKAKTSILGYLNAPSPFDDEGWYNTGDRVEQKGEYIRFLGRENDIINVGGQKVFPAEVESVLMQIDNINEATVFGKSNPIMGNVVAAKIILDKEEPLNRLKSKIRKYCKNKLEAYKVPVHIEITEKTKVSERFKKVRG
ncbi:MAG: fatty acid--CoA ligase family protein [Bacteroidales bacterium]|nr:fatty acid--CoA ligase family protein [Bacteroidales bacterium]